MFRGDSVFRGDSSQLTGSEVLGTRIVGAYTLVIYTSLDTTVLSVYCSSRVRCGLGAHTLECLVHAGVSIFIVNNLSFIRVELKAESAFYNINLWNEVRGLAAPYALVLGAHTSRVECVRSSGGRRGLCLFPETRS